MNRARVIDPPSIPPVALCFTVYLLRRSSTPTNPMLAVTLGVPRLRRCSNQHRSPQCKGCPLPILDRQLLLCETSVQFFLASWRSSPICLRITRQRLPFYAAFAASFENRPPSLRGLTSEYEHARQRHSPTLAMPKPFPSFRHWWTRPARNTKTTQPKSML